MNIDASEAGARYAYWNANQDPIDAFYEWENAELTFAEVPVLSDSDFRRLQRDFIASYKATARRTA